MMLNLLDKPAQIFKFNAAFYIPKNKGVMSLPVLLFASKCILDFSLRLNKQDFAQSRV